jgi:hypothetical protein
MQAATAILRNAEADRATPAPHAGLQESVETERITEWSVRYTGTAFHRDEDWFGPTMGIATLGVPQGVVLRICLKRMRLGLDLPGMNRTVTDHPDNVLDEDADRPKEFR